MLKETLKLMAIAAFFGMVALLFWGRYEANNRLAAFDKDPASVLVPLKNHIDSGQFVEAEKIIRNYSEVVNTEFDQLAAVVEKRRINQAENLVKAERCDLKKAAASVYTIAQTYVKQQLKAPSSASFASILDARIDKVKDCQFLVDSYVDASNVFGSMIRSRFVMVIDRDPSQEWSFKVRSYKMQ